MTLWTLIRRSLCFHARAHLGVVLGAAVGSAALIEGIDGLQFVAPSTLRPDVILRVTRDADDKTLHFTLLSPRAKTGYREKAVGSVV